MIHEFSKSKQNGIHAVRSGKERVIVNYLWSIEVPAGFSYCADYEKTAKDIHGEHYYLQIQKTIGSDFSVGYSGEANVTVGGQFFEASKIITDAREAKNLVWQLASAAGSAEIIKEKKDILVVLSTSYFIGSGYTFYVAVSGRNIVYSGQMTFDDDADLDIDATARAFVKSIEPVTVKERISSDKLVRLNKSYMPDLDTGKYLTVDNQFKVPVPKGYETIYDMNGQVKAAVVPKNAQFTSTGCRCKVGFVMYQDPINIQGADPQEAISKIKQFFLEQTGIDFYNAPITSIRDAAKGMIVYSTITNTPCDQNTNPALIITGGKAYHCFIIITYDSPISDEPVTRWDADTITVAWLSRILFKGEKAGSKKKDDNVSLEKAFPDKSLYPHYDHLMNASPKIPGTVIVINPGGTEYAFYGLSEAADQEENFSSEMRTLFKRIVSNDPGDYDLHKNARDMAGVFHVDRELFDMRNDREAELVNGYMKRAYMFSALRSFAWTLSDYCGKKKKLPDQVSYKELKEIVKFIANRNWLNYDSETYSKGLCSGSDLHVYYVPDAVPQEDKDKLLPKQEDLDRISKLKANFPSYNEILTEVQSLDALRGSLKFIYPAVRTIYEELAKKRDTSKPLEGNEADVIYAWCALAMAAKEPFFTEDGPMTYYLSQPERTHNGPDDRKKSVEKTEKDYKLDAHKFLNIVKALYDPQNTDDVEAAVNTAFNDAFKDLDAFVSCKSHLCKEAKKQAIAFVSEVLDAETDDKAVYDTLPSRLAENITSTREEVIEAENASKYEKAQKLFESKDLKKLNKAEREFDGLGDYKDSKEKVQLCIEKAESIRAAKYEDAEQKIEEGSEKSILRAIEIMEGLGSYKDAKDKAKEYRSILDLERKYDNACNLLEKGELKDVIQAQEILEGLEGYKDSERQNDLCKDRIEVIQSGIYEDAKTLAEEGTIESMEAAIAELEPIKSYRDSDEIIVRLYKQIRNERIYKIAMEEAARGDLPSLKEARREISLLEDYKDSVEKAAEYDRQIESLCQEKHEEAKNKEKCLSVKAQREAIDLYTEIDGWGNSADCIDACSKNIAAIKEIIKTKYVLEECKNELARTKGRRWKKPIETLINEKEDRFNELKEELAEVAGSREITISESGLTPAELGSLNTPSPELEEIRKANEKGQKSVKWRNIIIIALLIVLGIGIASVVIDVIKPDLSVYKSTDPEVIHGISYEIPAEWKLDTGKSDDNSKYYTFEKNNKIVAVTYIQYKGDKDLTGDAGYDNSSYFLDAVLNDIPNAEGIYDTVEAGESMFEVAVYCVSDKVKGESEYLDALCKSFRIDEYKNPRTINKVTITYTGSTQEGAVIDDYHDIDIEVEYDTGGKLGTKMLYYWKLKEPVTLKAGETSKLTVIVDGKEYSTDITCTTKPEDSKENKGSEDPEKASDDEAGESSEESTGGVSGRLPSRDGASESASSSSYQKKY